MSDEPVAYLGGDQGEAPPPADPPPPAEEEVDGYLGGAAADQAPAPAAEDEDLPALPPQEAAGDYSASDFIDPNAGQEAAEDPYADPYAQQEAAPEQGYGDYEGYDSAAVEQADPSYFDSMAHGSAGTEEAPPADEYAAEDDPDQPKTISQQDAESIIRRITTKRILPPDSGADKKPVAPPPPKLTESGSGLRIWPILLVIFIVAGMGIFTFDKQIAEAVPELRPLMFWMEAEAPVNFDNVTPKVDPNEVAKKKLLETVLLSEAKAFGVPVKDVPAAATAPRPGALDTGAPGAPGSSETPPAGGGTTTGGGQ